MLLAACNKVQLLITSEIRLVWRLEEEPVSLEGGNENCEGASWEICFLRLGSPKKAPSHTEVGVT